MIMLINYLVCGLKWVNGSVTPQPPISPAFVEKIKIRELFYHVWSQPKKHLITNTYILAWCVRRACFQPTLVTTCMM